MVVFSGPSQSRSFSGWVVFIWPIVPDTYPWYDRYMDYLYLEIDMPPVPTPEPESEEQEDECEFLVKDYLAEWRDIVYC